MKKIIITLILGIFLISLVSASWTESLNTGLVSYYKLDETSGTEVEDSLELNDGTNSGATVNQVGKIGKAYSFDGSNDVVNLGHDDSLNIDGDELSVSLWCKLDASQLERYPTLISKDTYTQRAWFICPTNKYLSARLYVGGVAKELNSWTGSINNGAWRHVVMVYNGTTFKIYVDNTEYDSVAATGNIDSTTSDIQIGSGYASQTNRI